MMKYLHFTLFLLVILSFNGNSQHAENKLINEAYIEAIGGYDKLKSVETIEMTVISIINGKKLTMISKMKSPDKARITRKMDSNTSVSVYNNGKGVMAAGDKVVPMKESELNSMRTNALIFPELYYNELGFSQKYNGITAYDKNLNYHEVEIRTLDGRRFFNFYNTKTNLLEMQIDEDKSITYFQDYREVDGILFPFILKYLSDNSSIVFEVTDININPVFMEDEFQVQELLPDN